MSKEKFSKFLLNGPVATDEELAALGYVDSRATVTAKISNQAETATFDLLLNEATGKFYIKPTEIQYIPGIHGEPVARSQSAEFLKGLAKGLLFAKAPGELTAENVRLCLVSEQNAYFFIAL